METREILELVKNGSMSVEEAEGHFRRQPFEDMGFAKLDLHRRMRSGFPEVIFCSGKTDEFLVNIYGLNNSIILYPIIGLPPPFLGNIITILYLFSSNK